MRVRSLVLVLTFVAACTGPGTQNDVARVLREQGNLTPDFPRPGTTYVAYSRPHGFQIEYLAPDGKAHLWYPGNRRVVTGKWQRLLDDICYRYGPDTYNPATARRGGKWECARQMRHARLRNASQEGPLPMTPLRAGLFPCLLAAALTLTGALAAAPAAADPMRGIREFNPRRDATGKPDFENVLAAPYILLRHQIGPLRFNIQAERDAGRRHLKGGRGAPLPVYVFVEQLDERTMPTRKLHRRLSPGNVAGMTAPFTGRQNQAAVVAQTKAVLAMTYCIGGSVGENHNYRYVDDRGGKPVVRRLPMIQNYEPGGGFPPGWTVQLTCDLWRKPG